MGTDKLNTLSQLDGLQLRGGLRITVLLISLGLYVMLNVSVSVRMDGKVVMQINHDGYDAILQELTGRRELQTENAVMQEFFQPARTAFADRGAIGNESFAHNESRHFRSHHKAGLHSPTGNDQEGQLLKKNLTVESREHLRKVENISEPSVLQDAPIDHPHAGAKHSNGSWGYVADVTAARRRFMQKFRNDSNGSVEAILPRDFLPFSNDAERNVVCGKAPGTGIERKGWQSLRRVKVRNEERTSDMSSAPATVTPSDLNAGGSREIPHRRILCAVYTHEKNHDRIEAIVDTWGWRCDGFFAASTKTVVPYDSEEPGAGAAIDLPHAGKEEYGNMWQKTRSITSYMFDNYLDYDYFYLAGDDTHLIVENLRKYIAEVELEVLANATEPVKSLHNEIPLYIGLRVFSSKTVFNHGGSGYLLNREALRRVVTIGFDPKKKLCDLYLRSPAEDRVMGRCCKRLGIHAVDSSDSEGRQRFHAMPPQFIETFNGTDAQTARGVGSWWQPVYEYWAKTNREPGWKGGVDLVSSESLTFHRMAGPHQMKRHHALLYAFSCPADSAVGDALRRHVGAV
jgi:hypothetical protein